MNNQKTYTKTLVIALIVSLCINVFGFGMLAGKKLTYSKSYHERTFLRGNMQQGLKGVAPETKARLQKQFRQHRQILKENSTQIFKIRQDIANEIKQPQPNEEKIRAHFSNIQDLTVKNMKTAQEHTIKSILQMPQEQREEFAERMLRRGPKRLLKQ